MWYFIYLQDKHVPEGIFRIYLHTQYRFRSLQKNPYNLSYAGTGNLLNFTYGINLFPWVPYFQV